MEWFTQRINAIRDWLDQLQRRHSSLGFIFGVVKKFSDDNASRHITLITYYAFLGLFPLLMVLVTLTSLFLRHQPELQKAILDSAFAQIPGMGEQLSKSIVSLKATGIALVVGIIGSLWGARGMANSMRAASGEIWYIHPKDRPGFFPDLGGAYLLTFVSTGGLTIVSLVANIVVRLGDVPLLARAASLAVTFLLHVGIFWVSFRIASYHKVPWRNLFLSAVLSSFFWQILSLIGTTLVERNVSHANVLYGVFGIVIGIIAYISLAVMLTVWSLEAGSTFAYRLWPRALDSDKPTEVDRFVVKQKQALVTTPPLLKDEPELSRIEANSLTEAADQPPQQRGS